MAVKQTGKYQNDNQNQTLNNSKKLVNSLMNLIAADRLPIMPISLLLKGVCLGKCKL